MRITHTHWAYKDCYCTRSEHTDELTIELLSEGKKYTVKVLAPVHASGDHFAGALRVACLFVREANGEDVDENELGISAMSLEAFTPEGKPS